MKTTNEDMAMSVKQIINRHFRLMLMSMAVAAILMLSGRALLFTHKLTNPRKPDNQLCLGLSFRRNTGSGVG